MDPGELVLWLVVGVVAAATLTGALLALAFARAHYARACGEEALARAEADAIRARAGLMDAEDSADPLEPLVQGILQGLEQAEARKKQTDAIKP